MYSHPSGRWGSSLRCVVDVVVLTTGVIMVEGGRLVETGRPLLIENGANVSVSPHVGLPP